MSPTDETSKPKDAEALHEQREWLRVTLSSIGDAVITTDTKGSITYLNPVAVSLTGWTQEEAAGTSDRLDLIVASAGARKRRVRALMLFKSRRS